MVQTNIIPMVNKNLFSDYYIKERLPQKLEEWMEEEKIKEAFKKITDLYNSKKELLSKYNEAQLEDNFIKPVMKKVLGHHFEVQETTYKKGKQPDYAFFPDEKTKEDAIKHKGEKDFYIKAISVGDAKKWDLPLDKKIKGGAAFEYQNPSFQIDTYLRETPPRWAILTNGRCWRIYYQETSYKLDSYYELDLVNIIERRDIEDFKYFYFFFRFEAFIEKADGKNFLDKVYEESVDYAKELGGGLQNNIYEALRILAEGFLNWKGNKLIKNKGTIKIIHDNSLVLLYRIIFILYSEDRGLLDITNDIYNKTYSLNSLKKEIADEYNKGKEFYPHLDVYRHKLNNLFTLINEGSKARGIPEKDFSIPSYNGGLFDPQKNRFLTEKSIGDYYLAKVVDLLARSNGGFVDYSTLDIRHLGSIYEGLLEYKLNIASEELVAIKEKGKEKWIQKKDADGKKICYEINEGGLYLTTDKGERKATGSYYTPEYIVKYIVKNTLGPVVEEKLKEVRKNNTKESDAILSIKVLDPAMGSGHFLVEAVDFLTTPLLEAVANDVEKELLPEWEYSTEWAKREIVSHCMYGVDLNPLSVELAKLSLWLRTIAKDKPLSFLDHRIKCGNSLIGANLIDLPWHPSKKRNETQRRLDVPEGFIKKLVETIKQLTVISDDTLEDIKEKERIFTNLKTTMEYDMIKTLADVRTSIYFGNEVDENTYGSYTGDAFHSSRSEWKERREKWFAQKGREIAENKHFFHWELEFPEIFFEEGKIKENPGFDAVVGNPPYGYRMIPSPEEKIYYEAFYKTHQYDYEFYVYFSELGHHLVSSNGSFGMILPNTFLTGINFSKLRQFLLKECAINELHYIGLGIFEGVTVENVLLFYSPKYIANNKILIKLSPNAAARQSLNGEVTHYVSQNYFFDSINISIHGERESIVKKMECFGESLGRFAYVTVGINTGYIRDQLVATTKKDSRYHKMVSGRDISRYSLEWSGEWICYDPKLVASYEKLGRTLPPEYIFIKPKLLIQRTRRGLDVKLVATYDADQFYNLNRLSNVVVNDNEKISIFYLLALINSRLLDRYFNWVFNEYEVKPAHLRKLPIRLISFTTPKEEREKLLNELKEKYQNEKFDEALKMVEECLPKDKEGNFITDKEKSDVIHDFLAFLAEQMIEMNKQKQSEIRGFTNWLEGYCKVKIDELTSRTKLQAYYKYDWNEIKDVLVKNKKKIAGFDITRRKPLEKINDEYDTSIKKLSPLLQKIESTDKIIDQIVYRLYGLTEEEIKIVEESIGKK